MSYVAMESELEYPRPRRVRGRFYHPWPCDATPNFVLLLKLHIYQLSQWLRKLFYWITFTPVKQIPVVDLSYRRQGEDSESQLVSDLDGSKELGVRLTWIGHATCLVQVDGLSLLTDPVFSTYCGPVQLPVFPKRHSPIPEHLTVDKLPRVDAVFISHNHFDHLDLASVRALNARFGGAGGLTWFVPLGLGPWMRQAGCRPEQVVEMSWWEEESIRTPGGQEIKVCFTPSQHWCQRGLFDKNKVLWGSWCVIGPKSRFFFAGDTGYPLQKVFAKIGEKYGPFDCSAIPIGAYMPRWGLKMQHVDPWEAVQIHKDVKSRKTVGIHWGTFALGYEDFFQPKADLEEALKTMGVPEEDFVTLKLGQPLRIEASRHDNKKTL